MEEEESRKEESVEKKRKDEESAAAAATESAVVTVATTTEVAAQKKTDDIILRKEKEKKDNAFRHLVQMGFTDTHRNIILLEEEQWDIAKVIDRLMLDSPATPDPGGRFGGESLGQDQPVSSSTFGFQFSRIQLDIDRLIDWSHPIGTGNFGDVYRGTYRFPGQQVEMGVAIKSFRGAQNLTTSMRKKIEDEVSLGVRLSHPNLVRLYGILNHPSRGPCLVLELCSESLRSVLNEGQMTLKWNIRVKWLKEIACGMTELHSFLPTCIIHRDLKAANVLLSSTNLVSAVAKVADFGVAITLETVRSMSSAGGGAGSLQWMAPETFKGRYSQKSDVYSFGVLVFEMVTSKLPFEGLSVPEITKRAVSCFEFDDDHFLEDGIDELTQRARWNKRNPLHKRRPDLDQVQPGCPQFLLCLMEKCWSDSPEERPDFKQICYSLGKLQEGRPYWGDGGNDLKVVLTDGPEKTSVIEAFQTKLGSVCAKVQVLKVERVQNPNLWGPFLAMRQTILERQGANDSYERTWLFHGTSEETASEIVVQGFNRNYGFKEVNKDALTMYGKGVYFAVNSSYSASHRYSKPNSTKEQVMFMCRVLVGEYCQGKKDQAKPDVRMGTYLYDSTVDNMISPEIFVIFNDAQALPEYIVTFIQE
jgi:poly [ADP-ribose] polymerase 10/14/15